MDKVGKRDSPSELIWKIIRKVSDNKLPKSSEKSRTFPDIRTLTGILVRLWRRTFIETNEKKS
jgi:hypothetical protein